MDGNLVKSLQAGGKRWVLVSLLKSRGDGTDPRGTPLLIGPSDSLASGWPSLVFTPTLRCEMSSEMKRSMCRLKVSHPK